MKSRSILHKAAAVWMLLAMLFLFSAPALGELESVNPLVDPKPIESYTKTKDQFYHVLLLGIDYGMEGYWGSGGKKELEACHTDAVMVLSINQTTKQVYFLSIPRDTLTYVPGVKGIYKLNAAVNCAETMEEGMENICAAVSWLLGGIEIKNYIAVDMSAMVRLGDAMGGVDFNMDMEYTGSSGIVYHKGMQHLNGQGIMDYVRARRNATVDGDDLGRTNRQREMMMALFKKLKKNIGLINPLLAEAQKKDINIFRNVHSEDLVAFTPLIMMMQDGALGSYVLTGNYRFTLVDWNFTITDQEHRIEVLKKVYGIDAQPLEYVSLAYTKWLEEYGLASVRNIEMARLLINHGKAIENPTDDQKAAVAKMIEVHDALVAAFDQAAASMTDDDTAAMVKARGALRDAGEWADDILAYPENMAWRSTPLWYRDPLINEYPDVDWR